MIKPIHRHGGPPTRLSGIDALRGLAALSVCLGHMTFAQKDFVPADSLFRTLWQFGGLGVQVFFVISGFVIPYSLSSGNYTLTNAPRFLLRRIIRIDPPYLLTAALGTLLFYLSSILPGYRGAGFSLDWIGLAMHVGYLNALMGRPWAVPVFWTLAIEFQYYIFVAIVFPLLADRRCWLSWGFILGFAVGGIFVESNDILFHHGSLFALGFFAWRYVTRLDSALNWSVLSCFCTGLIAASIGVYPAVAGVLAVLGIVFWQPQSRPLLWLGTISYSLYLTHPLSGVRVINLMQRLDCPVRWSECGVLAATIVSLAIAWVFWRLVELPSHRLARRINVRA